MSTLFLSLLLWIQGNPVQPAQGGTVKGVLRTADGKPASGVRIAAVAVTNLIEESAAGPTLSSITETDGDGQYTLENIPPGRYYVAAGRLDLPTYYPGTQSLAIGQAITINTGSVIQGIDFVLQQTSQGRAAALSFNLTLLDLTLDVRVEGDGKVPVVGAGRFTMLHLEPTRSGPAISVQLNASHIALSPPLTDYRVSVEGLPDGYRVKSMKFGPMELPEGILKLATVGLSRFNISGVSSVLQGTVSYASLPQGLTIVLEKTEPSATPSTGVHVRGSLPEGTKGPLYLYLSGVAGTLFDDGTFEFRNVAPGGHVIFTVENGSSRRALGAFIIVEDRDLNGVRLESVPALPQKPLTLSVFHPPGTRPPGPVTLASLSGHVLDRQTGTPLGAGTVYLVGDSWAACEIGRGGTFAFEHLLPGTYEVEVQGIGYLTFRHTVVIEDQDFALELIAD